MHGFVFIFSSSISPEIPKMRPQALTCLLHMQVFLCCFWATASAVEPSGSVHRTASQAPGNRMTRHSSKPKSIPQSIGNEQIEKLPEPLWDQIWSQLSTQDKANWAQVNQFTRNEGREKHYSPWIASEKQSVRFWCGGKDDQGYDIPTIILRTMVEEPRSSTYRPFLRFDFSNTAQVFRAEKCFELVKRLGAKLTNPTSIYVEINTNRRTFTAAQKLLRINGPAEIKKFVFKQGNNSIFKKEATLEAKDLADLVASLRQNQALASLHLESARISDAGVTPLVDYIAEKSHPTLKKLNLSYNDITSVGARALVEALKQNDQFECVSVFSNTRISNPNNIFNGEEYTAQVYHD